MIINININILIHIQIYINSSIGTVINLPAPRLPPFKKLGLVPEPTLPEYQAVGRWALSIDPKMYYW